MRYPLGFAFEENELRRYGELVLNELVAYLSGLSERPVWQPIPVEESEQLLAQPLPEQGHPFKETLVFLHEHILPYPQGNGHPRFAGWINSAPTHTSILLKPLATAMNPNCGIGDHAGQLLERCAVRWLMELCGFPTAGSAGVFVSGGSEANFTCLQAARYWAAEQDGWNVRREGLQGDHPPFVLYQSDQGHFSIRRSVEAMGLGSAAIHIIPSTATFQMDVAALAQRIREDRAAGLRPFCVAASAGTVETGAIDPLEELADLCQAEGLWLHVDGAYGAFAILDERVAPLYRGLERADSLATDQHKWLSVPIDCGCSLVRHGAALHDMFRLTGSDEEEAADWMSEYTLQRTRRFRALDAWATIRSVGRRGLAQAIASNIDMARLLAELVAETPELELICGGPLSIVRFRYVPAVLRDAPEKLDRFNKALARAIQQRGRAFFTSTRFQGRELLRACLVHYQTNADDIHAMLDEVLTVGRKLLAS
jgi:aromatic-L-amino-acid decarboxylase